MAADRPGAMIPLCGIDQLPESGSRSFQCGDLALFAVHRDEQLYLYRNICPHLGVELNWNPDQFLTADGKLIQCATHGALFDIESGRCIAGPCHGKHLTPLPFRLENDTVLVAAETE